MIKNFTQDVAIFTNPNITDKYPQKYLAIIYETPTDNISKNYKEINSFNTPYQYIVRQPFIMSILQLLSIKPLMGQTYKTAKSTIQTSDFNPISLINEYINKIFFDDYIEYNISYFFIWVKSLDPIKEYKQTNLKLKELLISSKFLTMDIEKSFYDQHFNNLETPDIQTSKFYIDDIDNFLEIVVKQWHKPIHIIYNFIDFNKPTAQISNSHSFIKGLHFINYLCINIIFNNKQTKFIPNQILFILSIFNKQFHQELCNIIKLIQQDSTIIIEEYTEVFIDHFLHSTIADINMFKYYKIYDLIKYYITKNNLEISSDLKSILENKLQTNKDWFKLQTNSYFNSTLMTAIKNANTFYNNYPLISKYCSTELLENLESITFDYNVEPTTLNQILNNLKQLPKMTYMLYALRYDHSVIFNIDDDLIDDYNIIELLPIIDKLDYINYTNINTMSANTFRKRLFINLVK